MKRNAIRILSLALCAVALALPNVSAQDTAPSVEGEDDLFSDEALFGGTEEILVEVESPAAGGAPENASLSLLKAETVKIGGSFSFELEGTGDPETWESDPLGYLTPSVGLGVDFYADARPDENFRVFVKGRMDWKPVDSGDGSATEGSTEGSSVGTAEFQLKEAFADFMPVSGVFMRAGKQTANWGVGWFFSPANLLDLATKDPENPEAFLPGPLAVKVQVPVSTENYYAYALLDDAVNGGAIALAPKAEWVIGSTEIGLGTLWQQDAPWAAMTTISGKLGDLDVFAEAVLRGNEDKVFVVADASSPTGVSVETREDEVFVQGTTGFAWTWDDEEGRLGLALRAQYFYNGLGYEDPSILSDEPMGVGGLLASGLIGVEDLSWRSRHYGAASLALMDIAGSDLGLSLFWLGSLFDGTGRTSVTLSWDGLDRLRLSAGYTYSYGAERSEFAPLGNGSSVSLKLSLTQGTF